MKNRAPILELIDLHVALQAGAAMVPVVSGLNLALHRGEILGMVGESGCGKSMTALSILRLPPREMKIIQGKILFHGSNLLSLSKSEIRKIRGSKIGMIFQDPGTTLNPVRTIGGQFVETLKTHLGLDKGKAAREAVAMLKTMELASPERLMGRYPFQLSGGMRQRVMIAMALSLHPEILIADEPTTALDVTIQAQILAAIRKMQARFQTAIMLISHNMGVIAQLCQEVVVMYAGTIVESGPVEAVFQGPIHPYTRGLLQAIPHLDRNAAQELMVLKGQAPEPGAILRGCPFAPRCQSAAGICALKTPALTAGSTKHMGACHFPLTDRGGENREVLAG